MNNIVTQSVRGNDFFERTKVIKKIYRLLKGGNNLLLAAPRRVGKTSLMLYLKDHPESNFEFIYVYLEAVDSIEGYYQKIWEAILKSNALSTIEKGSKKVKELFSATLERIKGISIPGIAGIQLAHQNMTSFEKEVNHFLSELNIPDFHLVFLMDEYPQALENIKHKHGIDEAKIFLHQCRAQRHESAHFTNFIYAGSIGLPSVVKSITTSKVINDLAPIELTPLPVGAGIELARRILDSYDVKYDSKVLDVLVEKLKWLIPHHIQLAVQEIIDLYESEDRRIVPADLDVVFKNLLNIRNTKYFQEYHERLTKGFPDEQLHSLVIEFLNYLAKYSTLKTQQAFELFGIKIETDDYDRVMESLQFDGYIYLNEENNCYQFTSELLRKWWLKFIVR